MSSYLPADYHLTAIAISALVSLMVAIPTSLLAVMKHISERTLTRRSELAIRRLLGSSWRIKFPFFFFLSKPPSPFVPFRLIQHHIGGYPADELRQLLVRGGALRFADINMVEYWALLSRIPRCERRALWCVPVPANPGPPPSELFPLAPEPSISAKT